MYQGFYNLASGMLTQSRNLNTISNNMVNIQTPGYKNETMVSSTFKEEMLYRTGQYSKENPTQLATVSKIKTAKQVYTNYDQDLLCGFQFFLQDLFCFCLFQAFPPIFCIIRFRTLTS